MKKYIEIAEKHQYRIIAAIVLIALCWQCLPEWFGKSDHTEGSYGAEDYKQPITFKTAYELRERKCQLEDSIRLKAPHIYVLAEPVVDLTGWRDSSDKWDDYNQRATRHFASEAMWKANDEWPNLFRFSDQNHQADLILRTVITQTSIEDALEQQFLKSFYGLDTDGKEYRCTVYHREHVKRVRMLFDLKVLRGDSCLIDSYQEPLEYTRTMYSQFVYDGDFEVVPKAYHNTTMPQYQRSDRYMLLTALKQGIAKVMVRYYNVALARITTERQWSHQQVTTNL